jgi:IS5 family transposase
VERGHVGGSIYDCSAPNGQVEGFEEAYRRALRTHRRLCPTSYYCVDSCYVKNAYSSACVGRNHTDRGRKALKLSLVVDQHGIPHGACCHPGNRPDVVLLRDSLASSLDHLDRVPLYADRGYDSRANRSLCTTHGVTDRIFRRRTKTTRRTNAKRIVVEHSFAWMKKSRRLLYMYVHSADQYVTFVLLSFGNLLCNRRATACTK